MADLVARIKTFLKRRPPAGVNYVRDSLVERLLAAFAADGRLDEESRMLLDICEAELVETVAVKSGRAADYFGECLALVRAIQAEI